jgi:hypothetical protein
MWPPTAGPSSASSASAGSRRSPRACYDTPRSDRGRDARPAPDAAPELRIELGQATLFDGDLRRACRSGGSRRRARGWRSRSTRPCRRPTLPRSCPSGPRPRSPNTRRWVAEQMDAATLRVSISPWRPAGGGAGAGAADVALGHGDAAPARGPADPRRLGRAGADGGRLVGAARCRDDGRRGRRSGGSGGHDDGRGGNRHPGSRGRFPDRRAGRLDRS